MNITTFKEFVALFDNNPEFNTIEQEIYQRSFEVIQQSNQEILDPESEEFYWMGKVFLSRIAGRLKTSPETTPEQLEELLLDQLVSLEPNEWYYDKYYLLKSAQQYGYEGIVQRPQKDEIFRSQNIADLTASDAQGLSIDLSQFVVPGKTLVIDFTASWCQACVEGIPEFNRILAEHSDDIVFISIALQNPRAYEAGMKNHQSHNPEYKPNYPVLFSADGALYESFFPGRTSSKVIPAFVFVNDKQIAITACFGKEYYINRFN